MGSVYGTWCKVAIWGQSHGPAIGVTIDGLPAGHEVNLKQVQAFMNRRAPGNKSTSTSRKEDDQVEFLSGLHKGKTCGAPLMAIIRNSDVHSEDYEGLEDVPRPGHADFGAYSKYRDSRDVAGGGHYSGRLTAPMCVAGAIMLSYLEEAGIEIKAKAIQIGKSTNPEEYESEILNAKKNLDSVGGVIECQINGMEPGIGEPIFSGIENQISQVIFGIPGIKGIEFGVGFEGTKKLGSEFNDAYYMNGNKVKTKTNNNGGVLGGMSNGMPIIFRVAVKPTSSIGVEQQSVSFSRKTDTKLVIQGRHDPCIVLRAIPCVEAAASIAIMDLLGQRNRWK